MSDLRPSKQRGVALLLVMWACTLLAILLGGYAILAHTEGLQANYQFQQARAHYAAEAGVMRAIYSLQAPNINDRWIADGRIYPVQFDQAKVGVSATAESGKVDLNAATPDVLTNLLRNAGVDPVHASQITQAIVDWRSFPISQQQVSQRNAAYTAAGRDYGPRNGPFASVEELQMVLGMTPELYTKVAPYVTIWSGRASPDPNTAPLLALASVPGMDLQRAAAIIAARPAAACALISCSPAVSTSRPISAAAVPSNSASSAGTPLAGCWRAIPCTSRAIEQARRLLPPTCRLFRRNGRCASSMVPMARRISSPMPI